MYFLIAQIVPCLIDWNSILGLLCLSSCRFWGHSQEIKKAPVLKELCFTVFVCGCGVGQGVGGGDTEKEICWVLIIAKKKNNSVRRL